MGTWKKKKEFDISAKFSDGFWIEGLRWMERNLNIYIYIFIYFIIYFLAASGLHWVDWNLMGEDGKTDSPGRENYMKKLGRFSKVENTVWTLGLINICWSEWNFNVLFIKQVLIKWSWNGFVVDNPCWEYMCWNKIIANLTLLYTSNFLPVSESLSTSCSLLLILQGWVSLGSS